jgi:hypothetical protein
MRIVFFPPRPNQRSLADFQIEFTEPGSLLEGLCIAGFSIWQRRNAQEGDLPYSITMPSRKYEDKDGQTQYWDFVRLIDLEDSRYKTRFLRAVIDQFEKWDSKRRNGR